MGPCLVVVELGAVFALGDGNDVGALAKGGLDFVLIAFSCEGFGFGLVAE